MNFRKITAVLLLCAILASCGVLPAGRITKKILPDAVRIELSEDGVNVNGKEISVASGSSVYLSNDIVYYKDGTDFTYGEGEAQDMHTAEEASAHSVINITEPGDYILSGKLSMGQIAVDLGDDAKDDPSACVTLVLNGVDITCSVAPAIVFYNVYECGDDDTESATDKVDTSKAGANIVIADDTENTVNGSYVAKIYKSVELNEAKTEVVDSKKLHKYDAAINSKMSMNIYGGEVGNGILNVNAENEGISTELHFTIYGGNINIASGNDGINTNEDGVSVMTVKDGNVNIIVTGKTGEGDGIDSNGWLIIEGGSVNAYACEKSMDSGLDADMGITLRGGDVVATGNMLDRIDDGGTYATFSFMEAQSGGKTYSLKNPDGTEVLSFAPRNGFSQVVVASSSLKAGEYTFWCEEKQLVGMESIGGGFGFGGGRPQGGAERPDFGERPDGKDFPKPGELPEGEIPDGTFPRGGKNGRERPEDMKGERPMMPPDGDEGFKNFRKENGVMQKLDLKEIFEIKEGVNYFSAVSEKQ